MQEIHAQSGLEPWYPFSAIVGQERMKLALLLNAINPMIGGVLIRGERGSAKSTSVRALATVLPEIAVVEGCPYMCDPDAPFPGCPHCTQTELTAVHRPIRVVDLPIGATEDRVLGTLDLEHVLRHGARRFEPGLLAAAHRGILSIDEVNLLPDHLVDILLDAAAMGRNIVERESIAFVHPARFVLIGTMNPEEGELRPQFLDRFGLAVDAEGLNAPADRAEVVRRRIAYETDPASFAARWAGKEQELRARMATARATLAHVILSDTLLDTIAGICADAGVDGLRADLTIHRTACSLAAYAGRTVVETADIRTAAELALVHRISQTRTPDTPFPDRIEELLTEHTQHADPSGSHPPVNSPNNVNDQASHDEDPTVFGVAPTQPIRLPTDHTKDAAARVGRRHAARASQPGPEPGRGVVVTTDAGGTLAVAATVQAAASHASVRSQLPVSTGVPLLLRQEDIRVRRREPSAGHCVLFVVDASGSMAAEQRMAIAKGAILSMLTDAYQRRDYVRMIAFRGMQAELILPPTRSTSVVEQRLRALPTGGRTPLAHALRLVRDVFARPVYGEQVPVVILLSDGRANVAIGSGLPLEDAYREARVVRGMGVSTLVLDSETGAVRLNLARQLANELGAEYRVLDALEPTQSEREIRSVLPKLFKHAGDRPSINRDV